MNPKFKQMVLEMALDGREKAKWEPWAKLLISFFEAYPDSKTFDGFCFFVFDNKWHKHKCWWSFYCDETLDSFLRGWIAKEERDLFMQFLEENKEIVKTYWRL